MALSLLTTQARATSDLAPQLKAAVVGAQKSLGEMPAWQKRLFNEEVVPMYQRFVKDYRIAQGGGIQAEIDYGNLRNYIRYYGPQGTQGLKGANITPIALVFIETDPACERCKSAEPAIQSMLRTRLERRGLSAQFLTDEALGKPKPVGKYLQDRLLELAGRRSAAAAQVISLKPAPASRLDPAHPEEKKFLITSFLHVRGLGRHEGEMEVLEADGLETPSSQLFIDAMTEMGARVERAQAAITEPGKAEILVAINGIRDFAHYQELRAQVETRLKPIGSILERKISRGRVVFAVTTDRGAVEVKKAMTGFEGAAFEVQAGTSG